MGLNFFKRKNNNGAKTALSPSSIHKSEEVNEYAGTAGPIIRCKTK